MRYSDCGQELGYIWQVHPEFDPFHAWREKWAADKRRAEEEAKNPKPQPKPQQPTKPNPYGYGQGKYMGD